MRSFWVSMALVCCAVGSSAAPQAAATIDDAVRQQMTDAVASIKAGRAAGDPSRIARAVRNLVPAAATIAAKQASSFNIDGLRSALADAELKRLDKQVGSGPGTPGSTSLVERGTVPYLLGIAVENGDAMRTQNGTSLTFEARPAGLVKFLANRDYLNSVIDTRSSSWAQAINKASLSISFDASRGGTNSVFTGAQNQVAGYSLRYDIYNHRDPRDSRYRGDWKNLTVNEQHAWTTTLTHLSEAVQSGPGGVEDQAFTQWITATRQRLTQASDADLDQEIDNAVTQLAHDILLDRINTSVTFRNQISAFIGAFNQFAAARVALLNSALRTPTLSIEYVVTRQQAPAGSGTTATVTMGSPSATSTGPSMLPDLGTLRVVGVLPVGAEGDLTLNASTTNFNNTFRGDRIRDYRIALQYDAPVADIGSWGKSSLSVSALYLHLQNQPLGQKVQVNGQDIDSRGNVWFGQAKFEFPFGASGIRLPIALTYASREELLKNEKTKFGANIGLTFDLDKLVAGKK